MSKSRNSVADLEQLLLTTIVAKHKTKSPREREEEQLNFQIGVIVGTRKLDMAYKRILHEFLINRAKNVPITKEEQMKFMLGLVEVSKNMHEIIASMEFVDIAKVSAEFHKFADDAEAALAAVERKL